MGLNLNIKRIIFATIYKNKGNDYKDKISFALDFYYPSN